jgi:hypothetical protein
MNVGSTYQSPYGKAVLQQDPRTTSGKKFWLKKPTGKPRNTLGNKCGLMLPVCTWRTAARGMNDLRNGTGEDMERKQAEEPYECPLEQSTFTEIPKC